LVVKANWGSFAFFANKKILSNVTTMLLINGLNKAILSYRDNMKYLLKALKYIGYAILSILLALQVISFVSSPDFIRGFILLVAGMYFANKWQKKNRPQEEIFIDEKKEKANAD
jgi:L-lactate permease